MNNLKNSLVTLNIFFLTSVLVTIGIIIFLRSGLEIGLHTIVVMYVVLSSATLTPLLLLNLKESNNYNFHNLVHFLSIILLCLPLIYFFDKRLFYINVAFSIVGHIGFIWMIFKARRLEFVYAIILGFLAALYIFLITNAGGVDGLTGTIYMNEKAWVGQIHKDTYMFMSIIQMLNGFDVVSTGLHGIPIMNYHSGFYFFISEIINLTGESPIVVYSIVLMLSVLMIFYSMSLTTLYLSRHIGKKDINVLGILIFTIMFLLILDRLLAYGFPYQGHFVFSLILAAPFFIFIFSNKVVQRRNTNLLILVSFFVLPVIFLFKISTALLLVVGLGYKIYSSNNKILIKISFLFILATIVYYFLFSFGSEGTFSKNIGFNPLGIIKYTALYVVCGLSLFVLYGKNKTSFMSLFLGAIKGDSRCSNKVCYILMLFVSVLVSILFSTFGFGEMMLLSALTVLSSVFIYILIIENVNVEISYKTVKYKLRTTSYFILFMGFMIMFLDSHGLKFYIRPWMKQVQGDDYNGINVLVSNFKKAGVLFDKKLIEQINNTPGGILKRDIKKAKGGKNDLLVYIPLDNKAYDDIIMRVDVLPFLIPSISGAPLLRGVPKLETLPYNNFYGYATYSENSERILGVDKKSLCKQTLDLGFKRFFVINQINVNNATNLPDKESANYVLDC